MAHARDGKCVMETRERPNGGEIGYKREDPRWPRGKRKRPGYSLAASQKKAPLERDPRWPRGKRKRPGERVPRWPRGKKKAPGILVGRELKESARDPPWHRTFVKSNCITSDHKRTLVGREVKKSAKDPSWHRTFIEFNWRPITRESSLAAR